MLILWTTELCSRENPTYIVYHKQHEWCGGNKMNQKEEKIIIIWMSILYRCPCQPFINIFFFSSFIFIFIFGLCYSYCYCIHFIHSFISVISVIYFSWILSIRETKRYIRAVVCFMRGNRTNFYVKNMRKDGTLIYIRKSYNLFYFY